MAAFRLKIRSRRLGPSLRRPFHEGKAVVFQGQLVANKSETFAFFTSISLSQKVPFVLGRLAAVRAAFRRWSESTSVVPGERKKGGGDDSILSKKGSRVR